MLLEANRLAVTGALLTFVFVSFVLLGTVWTFEMQNLLTETSAVQTILNTLLSGMILLVSIVVSINSIVLSHDMSSVSNQEDRVEGASSFRRELSELSRPDENPSDPTSFLRVMSRTIRERAQRLDDDGLDADGTEEIRTYASSVAEMADKLGAVENTDGAEFAVLWKGMEFRYGAQMEQSRTLRSVHKSAGTDRLKDQLDHLTDALELFAIGKEYFKTLYYTQEVSKLSQTLLVITLPAILINASMILAINAQILPDVWVLGVPPLQLFVAAAFTVSLAPYVVLTAYMLRLSAVARLTSSAGIFSLN
ncbi:hypothetical protein C461_00622 [Halorubrum aidingense JCM 13560]|uniref:Uncharacterized protein n=1 Tax=Halorubrum aidingense JCM 13560 TaxID=1230454 RepID=M0PL45_9EURY|nr:hypothetical protein C461_00622 [Halorubrum aidingense JCM 13560]